MRVKLYYYRNIQEISTFIVFFLKTHCIHGFISLKLTLYLSDAVLRNIAPILEILFSFANIHVEEIQ